MKTKLLLIAMIIPLIANSQVEKDNKIDGMIQIGNIWVDKYEAPNIPGEVPFVMFNYLESQNWCQARGKRLLTDDEWVMIAGGPLSLPYVYGSTYDSIACNDNKIWIMPDQSLINLWPSLPYLNNINTFSELIDSVQNTSSNASLSANHIMYLYQADTAGSNLNCVSYYGIFDMNGNILEWTTRSDSGSPGFHGNLKGGYWAQSSTIQTSSTTHGDAFRYYNTGFRCAKDSVITSIQTFKNNEEFIIYPNPTSQYLDINYNDRFPIMLKIISIYGQVISCANIKNEISRLDISNLIDGVYIIYILDRFGK
jgi:hypothetical protein